MKKIIFLFLFISSFVIAIPQPNTPCIDFGQRMTTLENEDFAWFFKRGDANWDGAVDISDYMTILSYLFNNGIPPCQFDAMDTNDDEAVNIADATMLLNYLYSGGNELSAPFLNIGADFTPPPQGVTGLQDYMDHDYNNDGTINTVISNKQKHIICGDPDLYYEVNMKTSPTFVYSENYLYDTYDGEAKHLVGTYRPEQVEFKAYGNKNKDYYSTNAVCTGVGFGKKGGTPWHPIWNPSPARGFLFKDWAPSVKSIKSGEKTSAIDSVEWSFTPLFRFTFKSTPSTGSNDTANIVYFGPSRWFDKYTNKDKDPKIKIYIGAFYNSNQSKRDEDIIKEFTFRPAGVGENEWGVWQVYTNTTGGETDFLTNSYPDLDNSTDWEHNYDGLGYFNFAEGNLDDSKNLCNHNNSSTISGTTKIMKFPGGFSSYFSPIYCVTKNGVKFYRGNRMTATIKAEDIKDGWNSKDNVCPYMIVFENLAMGEAIYKKVGSQWVAQDSEFDNQYKDSEWNVTTWVHNITYKPPQSSSGNY